MATRKLLHVGLVANDGKGDTLRDAAEKIEYNFDILFNEKDVEISSTTGNIAETGLSVLSGSAVTLADGAEVGQKKEILNTSGTSTVSANFKGGTTLMTMAGSTAINIVWSGTEWLIFSDTDIDLT